MAATKSSAIIPGPAISAARPWTQTAAQAASNDGMPRARNAAMIPASTSPVPALASQTGAAFCEYVAASPDGQSIQPVFGNLFIGEPLPQKGRIRLGDPPGFGINLRDRAMLVQVR